MAVTSEGGCGVKEHFYQVSVADREEMRLSQCLRSILCVSYTALIPFSERKNIRPVKLNQLNLFLKMEQTEEGK